MKLLYSLNVRLLLMFLLVGFLYSFSLYRNNKRKLLKSEVVFVGENNLFIKKSSLDKLLIDNNDYASYIQKDELTLNALEHALISNQMIEKSDVFVSIDGVLKAVVKQKTPIVRLFEGDETFYIDYEGTKMPVSGNYTARVPLVSGEITQENRADLVELFKFIYDDDFLKKNIISIQIMRNGSLKMLNRDYDYQIDFGSNINVEQKFKNYKAFFQKAYSDNVLSNYKIINLRFAQQVVCTKK